MFAKKLGNVIVDCCNTWYVIVISLLCWRRIVLRFYVILLRFLGKRKNSWNSYHELFMITRFETRIIFDVVAKNAKRFDLGKGREIFQSIWKVVDKR